MEYEAFPQYVRIAIALASRIAQGELAEGRRLSGRSTLSSEYGVSPETVRKSLRLLADMGIVEVRESSGTAVLSADKARTYLEAVTVRQEQADLRAELQSLMKQNSTLSQKLLDVAARLDDAAANPLPSEKTLPNYEVTIPPDSDKVGLTIGELRFWQCTGATVVAVKRGQHTTISPGPYFVLQGGDVLVYVGSPDCKQAVETLLSSGRKDKTLYQMQRQIVTAIHMPELAVVAGALGASLGDITDITSLTTGMTNRSFLFTCKGKKYILRIPGEGTNDMINRRQEADVYDTIRGKGLCDDVVYLNPDNGLKVSAFLEGVRNCDPFREEDLQRSMALLKKLHAMDLKVSHTFHLFDKIQFYESLWRGKPSVYADYQEVKARVFSLQEYITAHRGPMCLTHMDAVPDNFLFYPQDGGEALQLTDWEYAAMQDPHVDIAMFCIYCGYDQEQIDHLIDLYFEGSCDQATRIKIYCYISVCGLLWSNWCEYKRLLGVEFGEYALSQYHYARDFYTIVQKELNRL